MFGDDLFEDAFGISLPQSLRILSEKEITSIGAKSINYSAIIPTASRFIPGIPATGRLSNIPGLMGRKSSL